jgi:hypothetical protein
MRPCGMFSSKLIAVAPDSFSHSDCIGRQNQRLQPILAPILILLATYVLLTPVNRP